MGNENKKLQIIDLQGLFRIKRGSLRASQKEIPSKHRNSSTLCVFSFLFSVIYENKFLTFLKTKKLTTLVVSFLLRRKRDSNPRTCNSQQFSRLPHSTTLPFLRSCYQITDSGCKYRKAFHFVKAFMLFLMDYF